MKSSEEIVEILARLCPDRQRRKTAAELVGCEPHIVRRYVQVRTAGTTGRTAPVPRSRMIDELMPKIE
ncbi:hypothetical protein ACFLIM_49820 [Nonomuraea sp. M3C6]|uniref:Homeodomain-like domain-containing protein n=1 Tax=Nonomuraea marmarensis TaxID=3351344 RepID=A0ABW7AYI9_9ACTN